MYSGFLQLIARALFKKSMSIIAGSALKNLSTQESMHLEKPWKVSSLNFERNYQIAFEKPHSWLMKILMEVKSRK